MRKKVEASRTLPHSLDALKALVDSGKIILAPPTDKCLEAPKHVDASLSAEEAFRSAMHDVRSLGWSDTPLVLPPPLELPNRNGDEKEILEELEAFVRGRGEWDAHASGEAVEGAFTRRGRAYLPDLREGRFSVQAHLDLHGLGIADSRTVLEAFVRDAVFRGHSCVRVIHGRGTHSPSEPGVLKTHVVRWLSSRKMSRWVVAFTSARWHDGGSGAVYVLLYRYHAPTHR